MTGSGPGDRVEGARRRLMEILAEIDAGIRAGAAERCPHRAADDGCGYPGPCRNRRRGEGGRPICSGTPLGPDARGAGGGRR